MSISIEGKTSKEVSLQMIHTKALFLLHVHHFFTQLENCHGTIFVCFNCFCCLSLKYRCCFFKLEPGYTHWLLYQCKVAMVSVSNNLERFIVLHKKWNIMKHRCFNLLWIKYILYKLWAFAKQVRVTWWNWYSTVSNEIVYCLFFN